MKKVLYWLMGDKAGRTIVGAWNWMWGLPVESGGPVAVAVAEESLRSMQESVQKLAAAVSTQVAAYQRAKTKYEEKVREMQTVERQAITAKRNGNDEAARFAMSKLIQTEQILPQLESQVKQAEQYVNASKDKLNRERMKLEAYKTDMQNMKDMAEINEALRAISKVNNDLSIDSAQSQFEQARNAVQNHHLEQQALAEISENPQERLQAELENMTLDEEVNRRLEMLDDSNNEELPS
ncbi:PspA/IM30 family protein [Microcoleus sp. AR_TQ3_B6]|uniref:PspA/IM30 family protein n=1 Tax=Microcoleus sp. AR_TQ3_B6 TaxID=3055284 RepID=UPI002FD49B7A